jgi:glycosyltransferase involved in cell wall biosynthesis
MEAMAMGMPVVATDSGGVPELIDDGVEGLLLPPQDPERLSDALLRIAREPELAERLGKSAHLKVETHFRSNRSALTIRNQLQDTIFRGNANSLLSSANHLSHQPKMI